MLFHARQLSTVFSLNLVAVAPKSEFCLELLILAVVVVGSVLLAMALSYTHLCQKAELRNSHILSLSHSALPWPGFSGYFSSQEIWLGTEQFEFQVDLKHAGLRQALFIILRV